MSHPQNVTKPIEITPRCNILEDIHNLIYIYIQYNDAVFVLREKVRLQNLLGRGERANSKSRRRAGESTMASSTTTPEDTKATPKVLSACNLHWEATSFKVEALRVRPSGVRVVCGDILKTARNMQTLKT